MTRQGLWNHAIGAAEGAAAAGKDDDEGIDVRAVEIALVAGEKMFAVNLADPREGVDVFDFRTFGILFGGFAIAP